MKRALSHLLGLLALSVALPALAADACTAQIPAALQTALQAAFPEYRLPRVTDNVAEDVRWSEQNNGRSCLAVAKGDFDGSGGESWAIGLTQRRGSGARVVVAFPVHGQWTLHTLDIRASGRNSLYVEAGPEGTHDSVIDGAPSEAGEVRRLVCPHEVVFYGTMEATGVAWCYQRGVWKHVWISD